MASAKELIALRNQARGIKHNWNNLAQICAKYCLPDKATITEKKSEGVAVDSDVFDSTAIDSAQIGAAGLQGFLFSPFARWFAAEYHDKSLGQNKDNAEWLAGLVQETYDALNSTNFNESMAEFLHDLIVLPGATLYQASDPIKKFRFISVPFQEVDIILNKHQEADKHFRSFELTVNQAVEKFGNEVGSDIVDKYNKYDWNDKYKFIHCVGPRAIFDSSKKDKRNMPFYEAYVREDKGRKIGKDGGYFENPFFTGHWRKKSGDVWAYTPASIGISDILMLNEMSKTILDAGQMAVAPPWLFPDEDYMLPLNMNPHGLNYRTGDPTEKDPVTLNSKANMPIGLEMENQRREAVKKYFFVDMFLMLLDQKQRTAFEVAQIVQQRMLVLGPAIGRLLRYVAEPIVQRTMRGLVRDGHYPLPPKSMPEAFDLKIDYISPLAIAQKLTLAQNTQAYVAAVSQMIEIAPQIIDNINFDGYAEYMAGVYAVDPSIRNSASERKTIRVAREKAQAEANAMMMAKMGGEALGSLGKGAREFAGKDGKQKES